MADTQQQTSPLASVTLEGGDLASLLKKEFKPRGVKAEDEVERAVHTLAQQALADTKIIGKDVVKTIELMIAAIDKKLSEQINLILHHEEFQQLEGAWRGLDYMVKNTETDETLKIKFMSISKNELRKTLKRYEGIKFDQSPLFKRVYEEEFGQFGGAPFGCLVGDYHFDHSTPDVEILEGMAKISAAAFCPFITGAAPTVLQMDSWQDLGSPRDLTKIMSTPQYAAWNSLRTSEDSKFIGLAMPRFLSRMPYGARTNPVDEFAFEEDTGAADHSKYTWANAAYAMATNINRSFKLYGWCSRIRGVESGGAVEKLPAHTFPTDDGGVDMKCPTEIAISDRREAELAKLGFMPILHRKNTDIAAFIGAHSLQDDEARAGRLVDPDAQANERLSANLPYLFPVSRFAHYLKAMARDKVGTFKERADMQIWLSEWINRYVLSNTAMADDKAKAKRPLAKAEVQVDSVEGRPGYYNARFYLRPHYQLEGINASLRLVSELPSVKSK